MNKCIVCNKETKNKKYCSVKCKSIAMSKEKAYCLNCGKQVDRCETKFCSRKCYFDYKKEENKKNIIYNHCVICGKETKNEKYCSMKCLGKDYSRHELCISNLKNNHNWTKDEILYLKNNYGILNINDISKELNINKEAIIVFASKNNIKSQKKWKEKEVEYLKAHKEDDINILSEILNKSKFSILNKYARMNGFQDLNGKSLISPQKYITDFIESLNIFYLDEVKIGKYKTDILINSLDIEIQGTYWHCDERFFDRNNLTDKEKARVQKDIDKKSFFESKKIEILYLWEYDIVSNPEKCKQIILDKLKELKIYMGGPN